MIHHFDLHQWEITWILLGCWLLFLFILLYIAIRLCSRVGEGLKRGEGIVDVHKRARRLSSSSVPFQKRGKRRTSSANSNKARQRRIYQEEIL